MTRPVALITGSTRGIGASIACTLAAHGYDIVITGKTKDPHPKLSGTLDSVAEQARALGAQVLPFQLDVRDDEQIAALMAAIEERFGRLDVLVNNASAIDLTPTSAISMKRFDLMQQVNGRATFACTQAALPLLKKSSQPRVVVLCPPPSLEPRWFERSVAYTMSKYAMSLCVLGFANEFGKLGLGVHGLWPQTIIATAAVEFQIGKELLMRARKPQIVADALIELLKLPTKDTNGQFFLDEEILRHAGVSDFSAYAMSAHQPLPDLYTPEFHW